MALSLWRTHNWSSIAKRLTCLASASSTNSPSKTHKSINWLTHRFYELVHSIHNINRVRVLSLMVQQNRLIIVNDTLVHIVEFFHTNFELKISVSINTTLVVTIFVTWLQIEVKLFWNASVFLKSLLQYSTRALLCATLKSCVLVSSLLMNCKAPP